MRCIAFDQLRGVALLLMVLDHCLAAIGDPWTLALRYTLTRAALPLFMVVSGHLAQNRSLPSPKRLAQLVVAAAAALLLVARLPYMASVDVLAVYLVALVPWPLVRRWPLAAIGVALTLIGTFPMLWDGYHPGLLVALMALGAVIPLEVITKCGGLLPTWLAPLGRWPLTIYVLHIAWLGAWA